MKVIVFAFIVSSSFLSYASSEFDFINEQLLEKVFYGSSNSATSDNACRFTIIKNDDDYMIKANLISAKLDDDYYTTELSFNELEVEEGEYGRRYLIALYNGQRIFSFNIDRENEFNGIKFANGIELKNTWYHSNCFIGRIAGTISEYQKPIYFE